MYLLRIHPLDYDAQNIDVDSGQLQEGMLCR